MKKFPWKTLLLILVAGFGAYAVVAIYRAFKAGERSLMNLALAPFSALGAVASAVKGLFSFGSGPTPLDSNSSPADVAKSIGIDQNSPLYLMALSTASQLSGQPSGVTPPPANDSTAFDPTLGGLFTGPTLPWLQ